MVMDLQEGEVAVPIEEFPEYFITNRGRVWSTRSNSWLKSSHQTGYYYRVKLRKEGEAYTRHIHRLVGLHFLPVVNVKGMFICHKDETLPLPEINFVENLWVGNQKENQIDREEKGRGNRGRKRGPHTEETRKKIGDAGRGRKQSIETRQKISESTKGKKKSPETRRRMSESAKGKVISAATRKRMSEAARNRKRK